MSVYTNKSTLTYLVFKNTPVDKRNNQCFLKLKNLKKKYNVSLYFIPIEISYYFRFVTCDRMINELYFL